MTKELRLAKELFEGVERILCASKGHHLSTSKAVVTTVTKIKFLAVRSELLLHPRPRRIIGNAFALCLVSQKLRLLQTQCGNKAQQSFACWKVGAEASCGRSISPNRGSK